MTNYIHQSPFPCPSSLRDKVLTKTFMFFRSRVSNFKILATVVPVVTLTRFLKSRILPKTCSSYLTRSPMLSLAKSRAAKFGDDFRQEDKEDETEGGSAEAGIDTDACVRDVEAPGEALRSLLGADVRPDG